MPDPNDRITSVGDGRAARGRFAPGNRAARGNPLNRQVQRIRAELLRTSATDVKEIVKSLVAGAKRGDLAYIKEWLDRSIGKPISADVEERLAALEQQLAARQETRK